MRGVERDAPIGVFDSGVGGLTVVSRLFETLPNESVLYVADQAHVPYGGRDLSEIRCFALGITSALFAAGCKAVVMACNISSAVAMDAAEKEHAPLLVVGVIRYGAARATQKTRNRKIGVLTTEGTRNSGAYTQELHRIDPLLEVTEVACPQFVPLVEAGQSLSREAFDVAEAYLAPILRGEADTVILGCTHYPYLLSVLRELAPTVQFIDPAEATIEAVSLSLFQKDLLRDTPASSLLTTTGDAKAFCQKAPLFLTSREDLEFASATWNGERLILPFSSKV